MSTNGTRPPDSPAPSSDEPVCLEAVWRIGLIAALASACGYVLLRLGRTSSGVA